MRNVEGREFYTPKEVAAKIGVHYNTFVVWMRHHKRKKNLPPFIRVDRNTQLFPIEAYEAWKKGQ